MIKRGNGDEDGGIKKRRQDRKRGEVEEKDHGEK